MKKNFKKIGLIICGISVFLILLSIGINWWVNTKLPRLISDNNDTPYHIQYKELEIGMFSKIIQVKEITIVPKEREKDSLKKNGLFAEIERIKIDNFSLFSVLLSDKIEAQKITIYKPVVSLFKNNNKTIDDDQDIKSNVVKPFEKLIKVNDLFLENGSFNMININDNKPLFSSRNVTMQLEGITVSDKSLKDKIPFYFKKYSFDCDSLYYQTKSFYEIRTLKIRTSHNGLQVNDFSMNSIYNRHEFVNKLDKEKDLYTLKVEEISLKKLDWGFSNDDFYFKTPNVTLSKVNANIYRNKLPQDDLSIKPLYNKLLREIKFDLNVDTLKVQNSKLVYEEEKTFDQGAGKLIFTNFNMQALNLNSGFKKNSLPDVKIDIDCKFMQNSPMKVNWSFNPMDKSDSFKISGRILNFQTQQLAIFTKPYLNVSTQGNFDQVYFNFSGTDDKASGDFALKFSDLKIKVYQKKDREKESKLKSWVGNLLLKNDSKDELIESEIEINRIKEKSFFNYFWRCIAEGLKKTFI